MQSQAVKLLNKAKSGEKLTTKERRHVITWLQATSGDGKDESYTYTNVQLGELFGVTERTVRQDKMAFRKDKAKFIREDDVSLIIADIALDYEKQLRDIESSKQLSQKGSMTYLRHCTDAMDLRIKMVKALQDLGYYPKNLGQMTVTTWDFKAHVDTLTGYVTTTSAGSSEYPVLEGEVVQQKALPKETQDEIRTETANTEQYDYTTDETDYPRQLSFTKGPSETV